MANRFNVLIFLGHQALIHDVLVFKLLWVLLERLNVELSVLLEPLRG